MNTSTVLLTVFPLAIDRHKTFSAYIPRMLCAFTLNPLNSMYELWNLFQRWIDSLNSFQMKKPSVIHVYPSSSCHVFQAYIQTAQKNLNLPIIVHKSAKSGLFLAETIIPFDARNDDFNNVFESMFRNLWSLFSSIETWLLLVEYSFELFASS